MFRKLQSKKGFTLIELMIVVAILGVLAAVAIPQYMNYIAATKARTTMSNHDAAVRLVINEFKKKATGIYDATVDVVADLNRGNRMNPYTPDQSAFKVGTGYTTGQITLLQTDLNVDVLDTVFVNGAYISQGDTFTTMHEVLEYE